MGRGAQSQIASASPFGRSRFGTRSVKLSSAERRAAEAQSTVAAFIAAGGTIIENNGQREWRMDGHLHRDDGPALDSPRCLQWYRHGELHRIDGPAVEWTNGDREWYIDGEHHRDDGPAVIGSGRQEWWVDGERHRDDGPAIESADSRSNEWWRQGVGFADKQSWARSSAV